MKTSLTLLLLMAVAGCSTAVKSETTLPAQVVPIEIEKKLSDFGPFLLPEDRSLSSVSINWFTAEPSDTTLYFSMAGDVDWLRSDSRLARHHRMVFPGLEESAVYRYDLRTKAESVEKTGSFMTAPFGDEYQFDFAVVNPEKSLELKRSPNFLILMSVSNRYSEAWFSEFCLSNRKELAGTILLPMFDFTVDGRECSLSKNGLLVLRYRHANIVLVYKDFHDWKSVAASMSRSSEDRNYLFVSSFLPADIIQARNTSAAYGAQLFTLSDTGGASFCAIEKTGWVHFEKNRSFTLGMGR